MSKSDQSELHRAVVDELIKRLEVSIEYPDASIHIGRDFTKFLISGLSAAREGKDDPFQLGIKGRRGAPQRLDLGAKCQAWRDIQRLRSEGIEITESIRRIAEQRNVSFESMREIYYDKLIRSRAFFTAKK